MEVVLFGFIFEEKEIIFVFIYRVRNNIEWDWEYVKKGNKRDY